MSKPVVSINRSAHSSKRAESTLSQFALPRRLERIERVASFRTRSLTIVLDRVHNAHNISAVLRSADAFGIQEVHLIGDSISFSRDISLGAEQWLDVHRYDSEAEVVSKLREEGFRIAVLTMPEPGDTSAVPVYDLPFHEKLALVFGNEHEGVSPTMLRTADIKSYIPMFGFVESFNISVAAAITLFCSSFRVAEGARQVQPLSGAELAVLRDEWLRRSVRNSEQILAELAARAIRPVSEEEE